MWGITNGTANRKWHLSLLHCQLSSLSYQWLDVVAISWKLWDLVVFFWSPLGKCSCSKNTHIWQLICTGLVSLATEDQELHSALPHSKDFFSSISGLGSSCKYDKLYCTSLWTYLLSEWIIELQWISKVLNLFYIGTKFINYIQRRRPKLCFPVKSLKKKQIFVY